MKIALFGYGKMSKLIALLAKEKGYQVAAIFSSSHREGSLENADVAIDFSAAEGVLPHLKTCLIAGIPLVIGATGWQQQEEEAQEIVAKHQGTALFAPNFSPGVYIFKETLKKAFFFFDKSEFESMGIETHHSEKKDAPSGTAKMLQTLTEKDLKFQSIRMGSHPGKHEIIFDSPFESVQFTHEAKNRRGFAEGALIAAKWLKDKKGWYTIDDVYGALYGAYHPI